MQRLNTAPMLLTTGLQDAARCPILRRFAPMTSGRFSSLLGCLTAMILSACVAPPAMQSQTAVAAPMPPPMANGSDGRFIKAAASAPSIRASSYLLCDATTGVPIVARNADTQRAVASTQKIITAMVVLDHGNLDDKVVIQSSDVNVEPTRLGIRPGETYTRKALVYAFLIKSANDVAKALARDVAGSQEAFASMMNAKARSLGMSSSYFVNPHGLTQGGQHSTARDMARAGLAAWRYPVIRDAVRQKYHSFRFANGKTATLENTNFLLGRMPECNGMKTGYTDAAGRCLISSATSGGRSVILVQLGTKTKFIWDDARTLMSWGLRQLSRG
jgi:D-alanyl-D-alanine carboxypeptidase (penicillin-binding protein 5/6)